MPGHLRFLFKFQGLKNLTLRHHHKTDRRPLCHMECWPNPPPAIFLWYRIESITYDASQFRGRSHIRSMAGDGPRRLIRTLYEHDGFGKPNLSSCIISCCAILVANISSSRIKTVDETIKAREFEFWLHRSTKASASLLLRLGVNSN